MRFAFLTVCAVAATLATSPAFATETGASFSVRVTVEDACQIETAAKLQVHCSAETPYTVSMGTPRTVTAYSAMASKAGVTIDTITY